MRRSPAGSARRPATTALTGEYFVWSALAVGYFAVLAAVLLFGLWRTPFQISEPAGVLENLQIYPWSLLLAGDEKFVRPLYWLAVGTIWKHAPSVDTALAIFKSLHVVSVGLLMALYVRATRARSASDWVALTISLPALIGTSAFRENLENLPLNHMVLVGIAALCSFLLLERPWRPWNDFAAVVVAVAAGALKEPGLVVALMLAAGAWAGAPGVSRKTAFALAGAALAYVGVRAVSLPSGVAESIGFGFHELSPSDIMARFGPAPWLIYGYNVAAAAGNVLFGEPTRGIFAWIKNLSEADLQPWQFVQAVAYIGSTVIIGWWACAVVPGRDARDRRLLFLACVVLVVTGVLSFNYMRDRNVAVAAMFYALVLHRAVRAAAARLRDAQSVQLAAGIALLTVLVAAWQLRAAGTLYYVHDTAWENRKEWLVDLEERKRDFVDRPAYLDALEWLKKQGTDPTVPGAPPPRWIRRAIDYKW